MVAALPDDLGGTRDRALLLIGWAGALRRSELVAIEVGDLEWTDDGLVITIRRSKTDQEAAGRQVGIPYGTNGPCPEAALYGWLNASGIEAAPVFRKVDRHGHIGPRSSTHHRHPLSSNKQRRPLVSTQSSIPVTAFGRAWRPLLPWAGPPLTSS